MTGEGMSKWQLHIAELSTAEAAEALGVSASTISRARRTGQAPRALRDADAAASLQRAWSALRHTKRYREVRKAREARARRLQVDPPTEVQAHGRQGPRIDSGNAVRPRSVTQALPPVWGRRIADALDRGGVRAAAAEVSAALFDLYWAQPHGGGWVMDDVEVALDDIEFTAHVE